MDIQTKIICGALHYKVPCWTCHELIWTAKPIGNVCDQCLQWPFPHVGNPAPLTPRSDFQYHGYGDY